VEQSGSASGLEAKPEILELSWSGAPSKIGGSAHFCSMLFEAVILKGYVGGLDVSTLDASISAY
jgi:hypothetical protein